MQQTNIVVETETQIPLGWRERLSPSKLNSIPGRYNLPRMFSRSSKSTKTTPKQMREPMTTKSIAALQTSFKITDSFQQLRTRKWSVFDVQYVVLAGLTLTSIWIIEPSAPFIKTAAALGYLSLLLMPATRQFFLPSWPIWTYLLYFFSSRFIPFDIRPGIFVKVLPALEDILYGTNFSEIFSSWNHPVLDVIAWFPYGLGHFGLPAICSAIMFIFAAPGTVPMFAKSFGWMSALGVTIQLLFPCTPPWYERMHGLEPAKYGMQGSPAGLARIDALFGVDMYTTSFTTAPVPFGAFPSLHAADAILEALFISHCFPKLKGLCIFYVTWICWATMYLNHHYAVDLLGGAIIAYTIFFVVRKFWLPRLQAGKKYRWEYEYVEVGDMKKNKALDEELGYGPVASGKRSIDWQDEFTVMDSFMHSRSSSGSSSPWSSRSDRSNRRDD
ncbi:PAP2-domain-containing protein [Hypoxylon trugodes]|uniref:PAP2-domain-containing protein n=1 Tax=Hypoxylon trugodes TaxID=326681 RepID=UPI002195E709|nr:PAP2-domain-containing protein [Hypoxylon trugodes]KAI1385923.1 PAP2-domain-containing protein [Hypoxylon trugodes]